MKGIRIIAGFQLILAVIFAIAAWKLDPGVAKVSEQFAGVCHELSGTVKVHREAYADAMKNVFPMQCSMRTTRDGLNDLSGKVRSLGNGVQSLKHVKFLKVAKFDSVAQKLYDVSDGMQKTGTAISGTADVLAAYEKTGYPQTIATFDKISAGLSQAEFAMRLCAGGSRFLIRLIVMIVSLIFLLNAGAFWWMGKNMTVSGKPAENEVQKLH